MQIPLNPISLLILLTLLSLTHSEDDQKKFEEVYAWKVITFKLTTDQKCETCMPAGIKLHSLDKIFVSFPRWQLNVPATLAVIDTSNKDTKSPLFLPWPTLDMNKEDSYSDCLQSVLGFEILNGKLYALDQGIKDTLGTEMKGMKLMIFNIEDGKLIKTIDLTPYVDKDATFLNDIVIDSDKNIAYVSDSGNPVNDAISHKPKLLIIDLEKNEVRVIKDQLGNSMMPDPTFWLNVDGKKVEVDAPMKTGIDGIALSCDSSTLFYTPLSSRIVYAVSTDDLLDKEKKEIHYSAHYKKTASDGMIATGKGSLYMTSLEDNSIYQTPVISATDPPMSYNKFTVYPGTEEHMWPDTLAIYEDYLYFVSNRLNYFVQDKIDFDGPNNNFRIHKLLINDYGYTEGCSWISYKSNILIIILILFFAAIVIAILIFIFCREKGVDGAELNINNVNTEKREDNQLMATSPFNPQ